MADPASTFKTRALEIVMAIPKGKVMSYGQVAAYAGSPRAARQVGGILRAFDGSYDLPWWRVVNNAGRITIKGNAYSTPDVQKQLLEAENVAISGEYELDMEKYRFRPKMV